MSSGLTAVASSTTYKMPAEWEPHRATWLAWPRNAQDWPGKFATVHWAFVEMVRHLSVGEDIEILVESQKARQRVIKKLEDSHIDLVRVHFHIVPTDRAWLRDSGPSFVHDSQGQLVALDWHFNAWARYPTWKKDNKVAQKIAKAAAVASVQPKSEHRQRIVMEGGAFDVDGRGLVMATEECLLSETQARNPGLSQEEIEAIFKKYLGAKKMLWLSAGLVGDDTHGHIDVIARFVGPSKVIHAVERNSKDENYSPLQENKNRLKRFRDTRGRALDLVELPQPRPLYYRGLRLPATYMNFYVGNQFVIVPTYNDPSDRVALNTLAQVFPKREVVGIHAVDIVLGQGSLHCLTQQEPLH